jgi:hypothetical protein
LKRILLTTVFLLLNALAADPSVLQLKLEIMATLAKIYTQEATPKIYFDFPHPPYKAIKGFTPVERCEKGEVIYTDNIDRLLDTCHLSPEQFVIALSYRDYIAHKHLAAGAFFWQKGRPNIIINAEILKKRHIVIPKKYEKYVE